MCGCGGSGAGAGSQQAQTPTSGPQAPGYAWTGPKKRAASVAAKKPKQTA